MASPPTYQGENAPLVSTGYRPVHDAPAYDVTPATPLPVALFPAALADLANIAAPQQSYASMGLVATSTLKTSSGVLLSFNATNSNASVRYFQIFNLPVAASFGAVPVQVFVLPPISGGTPGQQTQGSAYFGVDGLLLTTGITWGVSTTAASFTAATASDHQINILYR